MARGQGGALQRVLRSAATTAEPTDRELLARYAEGDEAAFTTLANRHAGMVLGVCRRALPTAEDAEDACQAVFLILARKARGGGWQESVANWLYTAARRVASAANRAAARRAKREARVVARASDLPLDQMTGREAFAALDEELDRLPAIYREPLVLCYLEGLTRDEAAARLGVPAATLKSQLDRGRKRLGDALTKRGVVPGAGLLALAATSPAGASTPRLVNSILAAASGSAPAAVRALAEGVVVSRVSGKGLSAILGVVVALGIGLGSFGLALQPPAETRPKSSEPAAAKPAPNPEEVAGVANYAGRVLDPDGKPAAGAKLYVLYSTPKELPLPERGKSDKDGNFRFSVDEKKEFDRSDSPRPWGVVTLVAVADGYGLGFPVLDPGRPGTLQLAKDDSPITGRVLDLQGQPVAGATVGVHAVLWPKAGGDLSDWLADLKRQKAGYPTILKHLVGLDGERTGRDVGRLFPPTVTDKDGRFRLKGVGRERLALLRIEGPTIASTELWAMTRPGDKFQAPFWGNGEKVPGMTFVGADFEHHAAPGRPIVGTVRDKDTGKPVPGAVVQSYAFAGTNRPGATRLRTVADKEGRYRLSGMPRGEGNQVRVSPPDGEPYLMALARVPDAPGLAPATVDVQLKRGIWITGKVTDKATGKPVRATVKYTLFPDNPNRLAAPGLTFDDNLQTRAEDGTFRLVGLPGRAVVSAWSSEPGYLTDVGADRIKDFGRVDSDIGRAFHTVAEVNPEKGAESFTCDIALEPGRTLAVRVVGADGKALAAAHVWGLRGPGSWDSPPVKAADFSVVGLSPDEDRLLQFADATKKLAGSLVVRGDAKGPLRVTLGPAGVLTGRFVTADGKPLADFGLLTGVTLGPPPLVRPKPDLKAGSVPPGLHTDADGRFRLEGLAPGLTYRFALLKGKVLLFPEGELKDGVTVKAGESKELGDITVKPPDR